MNSILSRISVDEAPLLMRQVDEFRRQDLHGYKIANNTPLTISAIVKMMPFIKNGFALKTTTPSFLGRDPEAINLIEDMGYEFTLDKTKLEGVDIVLDCCAEMKDIKSAQAASELTKTGVDIYKSNAGGAKTLLSIDDSRVKVLETFYGTGEGFIRAFKEFVSPDISRHKFLVFGFGKVGKGIIRGLLEHRASCTVVDTSEIALNSPFGRTANRVLFSSISSMNVLLRNHDVLITCTGKDNFLSDSPWTDTILTSGIKLINMGAADEYGPKFPPVSVENNKKPLNFKLKKPTLLKFLDPVFYAHNSVVALYHDKKLANGLQPVPLDMDNWLVNEWHKLWQVDINEFNLVSNSKQVGKEEEYPQISDSHYLRIP